MTTATKPARKPATRKKATSAGARKSAASKASTTKTAASKTATSTTSAKAPPAAKAATTRARRAAGTTARKASPTPAKTPASATPAVSTSSQAVERARRGDLLDALAKRSPMRRPDLKVAMELVLEEVGKLLDSGEEVVLPPLGKLSVKKRLKRGGGDVLTIKLKRPSSTDEDA